MKKQLLFIGTFLISAMGFSQTLYTSDGTLSSNRTVNMATRNLTFLPSTSNSQFFINGTSGNVGIGTTTPIARLDVRGGLSNGTTFASADERNKKSLVLNAGALVAGSTEYRLLRFFDFPQSNYNPQSQVYFSIEDRNDMGRFKFIANAGGDTRMTMFNKSQESTMEIYEDGNNKVIMTMPKSDSFLGIGTTSFIDGSDTYRLSVNGAIRADRVKVYTTWADYVFEKNYNLPTLQQVEKHIAQKGHLKDIPSAKEVEEKGIELGEMNKLLLQKIEELTLYIIDINKKVQILESKITK